jgi:hypothetical protein
LNPLERLHKIVTIIVLMAMLLNAIGQPLLIVRETNAQYWAAAVSTGAEKAITQAVLPSECAGGSCNDEMAGDFEVGTFISTTVVADTVQLIERSIPVADAGDNRTLNESGNAIALHGLNPPLPASSLMAVSGKCGRKMARSISLALIAEKLTMLLARLGGILSAWWTPMATI